jgi:hypothetical protein
VIVLMPSFGACRVRRENQAFVLRHYERLGIPVVLGSGASRTHAVNDAARIATRLHPKGRVFIIADNDLIPDERMLGTALQVVHVRAAVTPHAWTLLTTPESRAEFMRTGTLHEHERVRVGSRSFVVLTREVFDAVNGMDELFVGWGPEDRAFLESIRKQVGPVLELAGERVHLWHPPDPSKENRARLTANRLRWRAYRLGQTGRVAALAREYGRWDEPTRGAEEHRRLTHHARDGGGDGLGAGRHAARPDP